MLHVENLTKVYRQRGQSVTALSNVSFRVDENEIVGLLGPNGAGKTTTVKCIASLIRPASGKIWIDGVDALKHPRAVLEKAAAVLEGNRNVYWRLTVRDNLEFFAGMQGLSLHRVRGYMDELIEMFGLAEKVNAEARTLSRGQQQKLAVACALIKQTTLLLLDEPTLGLDVETSYELRWALKRMAERGERTIVLSSHDMGVVQTICERVIIINQGRIVVDDRIASLKKLFQASAYRFEVEGRLTPDQERQLRRQFAPLNISTTDYRTTIAADVLDDQDVYAIIDLLRQNGAHLESVGRQHPDLEEIFLKVVQGRSS